MPRFLNTADWQIGRKFSGFVQKFSSPKAHACFALAKVISKNLIRGE